VPRISWKVAIAGSVFPSKVRKSAAYTLSVGWGLYVTAIIWDMINKMISKGRRGTGNNLHLVRKLLNFRRFCFGPFVERVFRMGLTFSVAFGDEKEAGGTTCKRRGRYA
jgi:hypothetical protein